MKKILRIIKLLLHIDTFKFIKYNFFSKNIVRDKNVYLIPHKGTVIELDKTARIYIKGNNIALCVDKLKKSKAEMFLRMKKNAKWYSNNGAQVFFDTYIKIDENAILNTGFFSINSGSEIGVSKKINIGEDVMMGRNIIIYDTDYHQVFNKEKKIRNYAKDVNIEDHVWLTNNVTVLKGVKIGKNSIVSSQTLIRESFPENSFIAGDSSGKIISECYGWSRERVSNGEE